MPVDDLEGEISRQLKVHRLPVEVQHIAPQIQSRFDTLLIEEEAEELVILVTQQSLLGVLDGVEDAVDPRGAGGVDEAAGRPGDRLEPFQQRAGMVAQVLEQQVAACQVLLDAVRRAGSLDPDRIRDEILKFEGSTVYGAFKVDADGFQVAHKMVMFQWQDGKKVIVWPEELAADRPRFPTPAWHARR